MAETTWQVPTTPNTGFVRRLWLVPTNEASDPSLSDDGLTLVGRLTLMETANVLTMVFQNGDCSASLDDTDSADGMVYSASLEFVLPTQADTIRAYLNARAGARWLMGWEDYNGQGWLAGQTGNGLRLGFARLQGGRNQSKVKLSGRQADPIPAIPTYPGYRFGWPDFDVVDFLAADFNG